LEISENSDRITDAKKRLNIEKRVKNHSDFKELPLSMQKKILRVESNLFFFKHTPADIISIAKKARETKEYSFNISSEESLTIEIYRKIPLNIGYLLATLSYLDVGNMEIFTLFDDIKYFRIDFIQKVDNNELIQLE
ncbi:MAG: phosphohydrolase, partial [Spirochaetes bacterium]